MLVNFNIELKDLNGKVILDNEDKPAKTASLIANCMMNPQFKGGDLVKKFELASRINQEEQFEIDSTDFDLVKKGVACENNGLMPLAKAQIILEFRKIDVRRAGPIKLLPAASLAPSQKKIDG